MPLQHQHFSREGMNCSDRVTTCANRNFQKLEQVSRIWSLTQSDNLLMKDTQGLSPTSPISI